MKKSMQAGLPIVPVTVTGSYALFPPKQRFIRPGTMCVEIGNPIEVTRFTLEDRDRLLQRVRAVIQGNLDRQSPMAALNTPGLSRRGPASASPHPF